MAPLALPGMVVGDNRFTYTDQSTGPRRVRITHEWVERSLFRPPTAPPAPVQPADGGASDGSDLVFRWTPARDPDGDGVADYHFELSDRPDMAWPLSSNFDKLVSNTTDRGQPRLHRLASPGLLTPGVRCITGGSWARRTRKGVWGPWGATWSFTARRSFPHRRVDVTAGGGPRAIAPAWPSRWKPGPAGREAGQVPRLRQRREGLHGQRRAVSTREGRPIPGRARPGPGQFRSGNGGDRAGRPRARGGPGQRQPGLLPRRGRRRQGAAQRALRLCRRPPPVRRHPAAGPAATVGADVPGGRGRHRPVAGGPAVLRSRGGKSEVAGFWEHRRAPRVRARPGPGGGSAWTPKTGVLHGVPDAAGTAEAVVTVTLERSVRRLDEGRLSWGQEQVKEVGTETVGSTTQRIRIISGAVALSPKTLLPLYSGEGWGEGEGPPYGRALPLSPDPSHLGVRGEERIPGQTRRAHDFRNPSMISQSNFRSGNLSTSST